MSTINTKYVFSVLFPELFDYDSDYNELVCKNKPESNFMEYPIRFRKVFYDYFTPSLLKNREMITKDYIDKLMNSDSELLFVKNPSSPTVTKNKDGTFDAQAYNKLTEEDYKFLHAPRNVREHTCLKNIVFYKEFNDFNVNEFLKRDMWPGSNKYSTEVLSHVVSLDNSKKLINMGHIKSLWLDILIERITKSFDEDAFFNYLSGIFDQKHCTTLLSAFIECWDTNKDMHMIDYDKWSKYIEGEDDSSKNLRNELVNYYNHFTSNKHAEALRDKNIKCLLELKCTTDNYWAVYFPLFRFDHAEIVPWKSLKQYVSLCNTFDCSIESSFLNKYGDDDVAKHITLSVVNDIDDVFALKALPRIIDENDLAGTIKDLDKLLAYVDEHKDEINGYVSALFRIFVEMMYRNTNWDNEHSNIPKVFTKEYTAEEVKKHILDHKSCFDIREKKLDGHTLAWSWIKYFKCEPFFEIYSSPLEDNLVKMWKQITSSPAPKEMTDQRFYDYMVKRNGERRPQNITAFYSFFSNSTENKFIFINNDNILENEAELRFIIPVEYSRVKKFLTEELETNGICLFTTISDKDWVKIAGGNDRMDCVVFSDNYDVYRNRTVPAKLISYIKEAIEIKFSITLDEE